MTKDERAKARALCDAATEGPWDVFHWDGHEYIHAADLPNESDPEDGFAMVYGYAHSIEGNYAGQIPSAPANADFIAAARTLLPAALDDLDRLTRGLRAIANGDTEHDGDDCVFDAVENLIAGNEWDGTAQKGGT